MIYKRCTSSSGTNTTICGQRRSFVRELFGVPDESKSQQVTTRSCKVKKIRKQCCQVTSLVVHRRDKHTLKTHVFCKLIKIFTSHLDFWICVTSQQGNLHQHHPTRRWLIDQLNIRHVVRLQVKESSTREVLCCWLKKHKNNSLQFLLTQEQNI